MLASSRKSASSRLPLMRIIPNPTMPACQSMFGLRVDAGGKHRAGPGKERREGCREERGRPHESCQVSASIGPKKINGVIYEFRSNFGD